MADVEYVTNTTTFENLNVKGNGSQIGYAKPLVSHKMRTLKWDCACRQIRDRLRKRLMIDRAEESRRRIQEDGFGRTDSRGRIREDGFETNESMIDVHCRKINGLRG